jgi:hypothetical protein
MDISLNIFRKKPRYKLGKRPARPGAVKLAFETYVSTEALQEPPPVFGHDSLVNGGFPMLCNDLVGDCAAGAGAAHQIMLWTAEAGNQAPFNDKAALANYSAVTGYKPGPEVRGFDASGNVIPDYNAPQNPTDQGTDVAAMLRYWNLTGLLDAAGNVHKIGAVVALEPGNWEQLRYASYYFDGVAIGINLPVQWMDAFNKGQPWTRVCRPRYEGGHYIVEVAWRDNNCVVSTWGGEIELTQSGYAQCSDESYAIMSEEKLRNGVDLEGLDLAALTADMPKLKDIS